MASSLLLRKYEIQLVALPDAEMVEGSAHEKEKQNSNLWLESRSAQKEEMSTTFIYGLCEPDTGYLRYVGKSNDPKKRFANHLCPIDKSHRTSWIKNLKTRGLRPEMFIIEEIDRSSWEEAERFWICYFKAIGCPLINATLGGDGVSGVTEQTKEKLRAYAKIRPSMGLAGREKLSRLHSGNKYRLGQKGTSSLKGKKISETHRLRIIAALIGRKVSPESREKIRLGNLGKHAAASKRCKGVPRSAKDIAAMRAGRARARDLRRKAEQLDLLTSCSFTKQEIKETTNAT